MEYIEIGPTPADEECTDISHPDYTTLGREECRRFIDLIRKVLGPEPQGARLAVKGFSHDFGTYYEVVCKFDGSCEAAVDYAFRVEREAPSKWDETKT